MTCNVHYVIKHQQMQILIENKSIQITYQNRETMTCNVHYGIKHQKNQYFNKNISY